jgi:hypothetical protein
MNKFRLSRKHSDAVLTKFQVINCADDGIVGSINVPTEQADDLEKHWLGGATQPQASAVTKKGGALAAALEAAKRPGSLAPAASKPNPAVNAMLRAAPKNRLTRSAILRGC